MILSNFIWFLNSSNILPNTEATGRYQLRRCRYIGLAKTLLQHVITAAAINFSRMWDWWQHVPRSQTHVSHFARIAPTAS